MTQLINKDKVDLTVYDGDVTITIKPGESVNVDGRRDWSDNLFVKAELLGVIEDKPKAKSKK
ncbi:hypothetical protein NVP1016O_35 [Vibrio phage 1.016.O._10N.286.46.A11]|nr:hypothetical protein NVP1016O_35 [Vibrio phage 1.016.O._10N.286.46.A11]AUR85265.1 hypothetical protein NVP1071A_35 [Vibrio phage 1.071.A._10N.286.46.A12]